uniref:Uncharacterized protein n=1 Tax=Aegilops tauschii subsp. strangulata TaxID=200361 RepID=A0A453NX71_AEGTS
MLYLYFLPTKQMYVYSKKTRSSKNNGSLSPGRGKSFGRSHKKISSNKKRLLSRSQVLYSTPPEDVH